MQRLPFASESLTLTGKNSYRGSQIDSMISQIGPALWISYLLVVNSPMAVRQSCFHDRFCFMIV